MWLRLYPSWLGRTKWRGCCPPPPPAAPITSKLPPSIRRGNFSSKKTYTCMWLASLSGKVSFIFPSPACMRMSKCSLLGVMASLHFPNTHTHTHTSRVHVSRGVNRAGRYPWSFVFLRFGWLGLALFVLRATFLEQSPGNALLQGKQRDLEKKKERLLHCITLTNMVQWAPSPAPMLNSLPAPSRLKTQGFFFFF